MTFKKTLDAHPETTELKPGEVRGPFNCPFCRQTTSPPVASKQHDVYSRSRRGTSYVHTYAGVRRCDNPTCKRVFAFVEEQKGAEQHRFTAPSIGPELDLTGAPEVVSENLLEAVDCFAAECFRAAGIMVRRTLEALCDELGAKGGSLHDRIKDLKNHTSVSADLLDLVAELKVFGNDATHSKVRDYPAMTKELVEDAILATGRIIQAVYQDQDLIKKLQKHKPSP